MCSEICQHYISRELGEKECHFREMFACWVNFFSRMQVICVLHAPYKLHRVRDCSQFLVMEYENETIYRTFGFEMNAMCLAMNRFLVFQCYIIIKILCYQKFMI
jgi:hypothetical protein